MNIFNANYKFLFIYLSRPSSIFVKLDKSGEVWLLNCFEGCQQILIKKNIKLSNIIKIIFTDLTLSSIAGLLGLLSSLSLYMRDKHLDIYGPYGLHKYISLIKKYCHTNFRYTIYIHSVSNSLIEKSNNFRLYAFYYSQNSIVNYYLVFSEKVGKFNMHKASDFLLPAGSLYSCLKKESNFIVPDGLFIYGYLFIENYYLGFKIVYLSNNFHQLILDKLFDSTLLIGA